MTSGSRSRDLAGGFRFARQGGLVDPEGSSLDQAHVGGHDVPRIEAHEVARHELGRRDDGRLTGTHDAGRRAGHPLQRVHRLLRPVFLDEPDDPVERDDDQDDGGVLEVADRRRDRGRAEEDEDHRVGELLGQEAPGGLAGARLQLVRPVRDQATPGFVGVEATIHIGAEGGDDFRELRPPTGPGRGPSRGRPRSGRLTIRRRLGACSRCWFRFVAPGVVGGTSAGTITSVNAATRSAAVPIGPIGGIGHPESGDSGPWPTTLDDRSVRLGPASTAPADRSCVPRRRDGQP